jgi:hypothetical protein
MGRWQIDAMVVLVLGDAELASWPLADCDLAMVDALARLQLEARRAGCSIQLRDASGELTELLDLAGLGDVVPGSDSDGGSSPGGSSQYGRGPLPQPPGRAPHVLREAGRQAEGGEEGGVEEVVMPHDPVA